MVVQWIIPKILPLVMQYASLEGEGYFLAFGVIKD